MLDISPETETRLSDYAASEGVDAEEAINRLLQSVRPKVRPQAIDNPMLKRLQAQLREAEQATPSEIAQAEAEWLTLQHNLNENRRINGERLLFPEVP